MTTRRLLAFLLMMSGSLRGYGESAERDAYITQQLSLLGGTTVLTRAFTGAYDNLGYVVGTPGVAHVNGSDVYVSLPIVNLWIVKYEDETGDWSFVSVVDQTARVEAIPQEATSGVANNGVDYFSVSGVAHLVVRAFTDYVVGDQAQLAWDHLYFHIDTQEPTITPKVSPEWWTNRSVTVSAVASDAGSGVNEASLRWSLDQIGWNSGRYAEIDSNGPVYFSVQDNVGNWGFGSFSVQNIDRGLPNVSISGNPVAWTNAAVTLTAFGQDTEGSGVDVDTYQWSLNQADWYGGQTAVVSENRTVYFHVQDSAGNRSADAHVDVTKIDKTPPAVTISGNPTAWTKDPVTLTASGQDTGGSGLDSATYRWSLDGSSWTAGSSKTVSQNCTVYFQVQDIAGNWSADAHVDVTKIDTEAPTVTISGNPTAWTNGTVTLTASGTDTGGSGVNAAKYQWSLNGTNWTDGQSKTVSANCTVYFRVQDNAGNWSVATPANVTKIDTLIPTLTISGNPTAWTNGTVTLTASASDTGGSGVGTYQWSLNGTNWTNGQSKTVSANGRVYFRVQDSAGNWSTNAYVDVAKIDTTPPVITPVASTTSQTNQTVTVTATATDAASGVDAATWKYCFDNVTWIAAPWVATAGASIPVSQNATVYLQVQDNVDNLGSASIAVGNIDTVPPIVTPVVDPPSVPNNTWSKAATSAQVSVDVSDAASLVALTEYWLRRRKYIKVAKPLCDRV